MSRRPARTVRSRRSQAERSAETRAKLIQAAIDLIGRRGYGPATTEAIAAAAGVSRGALQHQFASRYELIAAVNERLTGDMRALGQSLRGGKRPLPARLDAVIRRYLSVYSSPTYLAILNLSLGVRDAGLRRRMRRHVANIYRKSDAPWLDLFADTGLPKPQLVHLRRMALATLRGLAIAQFLDIERQGFDAELALLKQTLLDRLGGRRDRA
jgi:AcrR family transcriptional regulator